MSKRVLIGGVLGGLLAFFWSNISWMVLPIHDMTFLRFSDEAAVTAAIAANAPASGVYLLPRGHGDTSGLAPEVAAQQEAAMRQWQTGPTALMAVRVNGMSSMLPHILIQVATLLVAGLLIAWLVSKTTGLGYWGRVGFVVVVGLVAAIVTNVPDWNWWGFSTAYTAAAFADHLIGWFLGGLVIAKFST